MICLICGQSETVDHFASVKFERGEFRLVVRGVPVRFCPSCGESYVIEEVAVRLLQHAAESTKAGILDSYSQYPAA